MARQFTREQMIAMAQKYCNESRKPAIVYPHPLLGHVYNADKKNIERAKTLKDERVTFVYPEKVTK